MNRRCCTSAVASRRTGLAMYLGRDNPSPKRSANKWQKKKKGEPCSLGFVPRWLLGSAASPKMAVSQPFSKETPGAGENKNEHSKPRSSPTLGPLPSDNRLMRCSGKGERPARASPSATRAKIPFSLCEIPLAAASFRVQDGNPAGIGDEMGISSQRDSWEAGRRDGVASERTIDNRQSQIDNPRNGGGSYFVTIRDMMN